MPRKPFTPQLEPNRKLKGSKIWLGIVWNPGDEHRLPEDFPQDGPWWDDWYEDPVKTLEEQKAAFGVREDSLQPGEVPTVNSTSPSAPDSVWIDGDPLQSDEQIAYERANGTPDALPRTSQQKKPGDPRRTRV